MTVYRPLPAPSKETFLLLERHRPASAVDLSPRGLRQSRRYENLVLAAEAQVSEATSLLEQTKALAESIRSQVKIQTDALENLNARLKLFGSHMLEAHRKFNGSS